MDKPSIPKGTRDFGPVQMARRQYILHVIRTVFEKFGFQPLETPAMENLSTLTGKYGDEGDQLLFRILDSGDFLKDVDKNNLERGDWKSVSSQITGKGLKYDLTVPFARYVVMNRHEITFPFRRYQVQPVWRADRPQKGRYREFVQCDADVIGTDSLVCELEIILMIKEVLAGLGVSGYTIRINHRGILSGLAEIVNAKDAESSLLIAIDKLDKIGAAKVEEELRSKGIKETDVQIVFEILQYQGSAYQKASFLAEKLKKTEKGIKGIEDVKKVFSLLNEYGASNEKIEFDLTLARGLSYYTGCIFEVTINNVAVGSVSGGGRYDNLTGVFGMPGISGVGISFGVDRLYDALDELKVFPDETRISSKVLLCHLDEECFRYALKAVRELREKGIAAEIYPDQSKLKKQFEYADKKGIPFTIIVGSDEIKSGKLTFRNMRTGDQQSMTLVEIISKF